MNQPWKNWVDECTFVAACDEVLTHASGHSPHRFYGFIA